MNSTVLFPCVHGCLGFVPGTESLGLQLGQVSAELTCASPGVRMPHAVWAGCRIHPALLDP